jgi:hypothetical protein
MYTGKAIIEVPMTNHKGNLGEAWELYRLAEQYEIESLSTFCESVMRKSIGKPGDKQEEEEAPSAIDSCDSPMNRASLMNVTSPSDRWGGV